LNGFKLVSLLTEKEHNYEKSNYENFHCLSLNALAEGNSVGKYLVLNLVGTGAMYKDYVTDIDGDGAADEAICFDVDLFNAKNQQLIATATDCLSNVTPVGTGLALVGTTTFNFPSGSLTVRGNTSVLPVVQTTVTPDSQNITHVTGASSTEDAVLHGSMKFANATGTARLSGMVDLSGFGGEVGDPIYFNCVFVIDLD
jgi:hypothetical protein